MAVHIFSCVKTFENEKMTSQFLSESIGTNPVIIRKLLQQLKSAGLIEVARGTGGIKVIKPYSEITLLDIYNAVESTPEKKMFHFHENPNSNCPVGKNIHKLLDVRLKKAQKALENELANTTLENLNNELAEIIK